MSREEMASLLEQLLQLENPYHCPHGRPTIITMSKYELERKFQKNYLNLRGEGSQYGRKAEKMNLLSF